MAAVNLESNNRASDVKNKAFQRQDEAKNLFSAKENPRREANYYLQKDPEKMDQQIEKSKEFAIQMILASVKNMDPFAQEQGGSSGNEMLQTTNLIAQLDAMQVQNLRMKEMVEAVKNPGFSASELQGMEVDYDDSLRGFDGKKNVTFNYSLSFDEKFEKSDKDSQALGAVKTNIQITDIKGNVIFASKGAETNGDHQFVWDGRGNDGKVVEPGQYKILVKATGVTQKDGNNGTFPVKAQTSLKGVVSSVEIENGLVTSLTLEGGKVITKSQVTQIGEKKKEVKPSLLADISMIGKRVDLDLSKFQIKKGSAEIYYNNEFEKPEDIQINIFDQKNRKVKIIDYKGKLDKGQSSLTLKEQIKGLDDGNYTAEIMVKENSNDSRRVKLESKLSELVVGIKTTENKVITREGKEFDAHLIEATLGDFRSPLSQAQAEYQGKEVEYKDDVFVKKERANIVIDRLVDKPQATGVLYESNLRVYNEKNELVQVVKKPYDAFNMLTSQAQRDLHGFMNANFSTQNDKGLNPQEKARLNQEIETRLSGNKNLLKPEHIKNFENAKIPMHYEWDGSFSNKAPESAGKVAKTGDQYRVELEHIYINPKGEFFTNENPDLLVTNSIIEEVSRENGEYFFHLSNGATIPAEKALSFREIEG